MAQTGPLAPVTKAEYQGLEAGVKYVNSHGGIDGHTAKLSEFNDNFDPTTAASLLDQQISSGTPPDLVFAGTTSTETLAMVPITTAHKILSLQATVSNKTITAKAHPYAFTLGPATPDAAATLAAVVKKEYPNAKTVGIIIENGVNGLSLLGNEKAALQKAGFTVVDQTYDPTSVTVTPELQALQAQNPDVLVASGFGAVAGAILKDRAKLGWNVPVVGDASFSANALTKLVTTKADLNGVSIATLKSFIYKPLAQHSAAFQTFWTLVKSVGGKFTQQIVLYTIGYDVPVLAKMAATQAKSVNTVSMSKALENLKQPAHPAYVSYTIEQYSATKHSPILPTSLATPASPYIKTAQFLPVGSSSSS